MGRVATPVELLAGGKALPKLVGRPKSVARIPPWLIVRRGGSLVSLPTVEAAKRGGLNGWPNDAPTGALAIEVGLT